MIDFLNNPKYREYLVQFAEQKKQQYAATELAYILRGLDEEPELLALCSIDNIKMIKGILKQEAEEAALTMHKPMEGDIICKQCGYPVVITWCRHIRKEKLAEALKHTKGVWGDGISYGDAYPEADCGCTYGDRTEHPTISAADLDRISNNPLMENYVNVIFFAEEE